MDIGDPKAIISGVSLIGVIVLYMIRSELRELDGRQKAHERECGERQKRLDERHEELKDAIHGIGTKLDQLFGPVSNRPL